MAVVARRHTRGPHGPSAEKLVGDLVNIRAITNHFNPRIATWKSEKGLTTLSTEEVGSPQKISKDFTSGRTYN